MKKTIIAIVVAAILLTAGIATALFVLNKKDDDRLTIEDLAATGNYLKIFGNANGDYLINEDDVQIIQDYVDGKITKEDLIVVEESDIGNRYYLADANCDGKVDEEDIAVLRGIIDRTGEYMKFLDAFGHLLQVPLEIERVACDYFASAELVNMCGAQDKIVGVPKALMVLKDYYLMNVPDISKVVNFNSRAGTDTDYEALAEADPQVWIMATDSDWSGRHKGKTNAVVVSFNTAFDFDDVLSSGPIMSALLAGYMFNAPEKGIQYAEWYIETWNKLNDKTSKLTKDQRPTVFYTGYGRNMEMAPDGTTIETSTKDLRCFVRGDVCWQAVKLAGGHNLIDDHPPFTVSPTGSIRMDLEWLSQQKYDYTFVHCTKYTGGGLMSPIVPDHGYLCDDPAEYRKAQDTLSNVTVLKSGCKAENMYLTPGDFMNGASGGLMSAIMVATVINADLFPDLDLMEEFQTYIDLMGYDYDVSKHGTFFLAN